MKQNISSDHHPWFRFPSTPIQPNILDSPSSSSHVLNYDANPRKKRSKLIKMDAVGQSPSSSNAGFRPKYTKKPDPSAPKITRPCTECGKKFWSWKALFGHMRCHPERQWRGINPPPNFRRPDNSPIKQTNKAETLMTVEDQEIAASLLMLANGAAASASGSECGTSYQLAGVQDSDGRFECSSCKKVFGSHQALGGHRASHKNVKGCFAITRHHSCEVEDHISYIDDVLVKDSVEDNSKMMSILGHQCSICLKVFSSGQALGGHKRCHWEKVEEPLLNQGLNLLAAREDYGLDLNLPAPPPPPPPAVAAAAAPLEIVSSVSFSSGLALDLRLGL